MLKKILKEITQRSRFIPCSIPLKKEAKKDEVDHEDEGYGTMKYYKSSEIYRPSNKFKENNSKTPKSI